MSAGGIPATTAPVTSYAAPTTSYGGHGLRHDAGAGLGLGPGDHRGPDDLVRCADDLVRGPDDGQHVRHGHGHAGHAGHAELHAADDGPDVLRAADADDLRGPDDELRSPDDLVRPDDQL